MKSGSNGFGYGGDNLSSLHGNSCHDAGRLPGVVPYIDRTAPTPLNLTA